MRGIIAQEINYSAEPTKPGQPIRDGFGWFIQGFAHKGGKTIFSGGHRFDSVEDAVSDADAVVASKASA